MIKLVLGVFIWSFVHFIPAAAAGFRNSLVAKLGLIPYKGIYSLIMFFALYLIISGWKATIPESLYLLPQWARHATSLLVLLGFILFLAPYPGTNLKRFLRHPQLIGVVCWGIGHLLANGDTRSIVLFGGLAAWAVVQMWLLNRRDGAWVKPEPVARKKDIVLVVAGLVVYVVAAVSHQWLFGFSPFV